MNAREKPLDQLQREIEIQERQISIGKAQLVLNGVTLAMVLLALWAVVQRGGFTVVVGSPAAAEPTPIGGSFQIRRPLPGEVIPPIPPKEASKVK